jgi:hypothetical protein
MRKLIISAYLAGALSVFAGAQILAAEPVSYYRKLWI